MEGGEGGRGKEVGGGRGRRSEREMEGGGKVEEGGVGLVGVFIVWSVWLLVGFVVVVVFCGFGMLVGRERERGTEREMEGGRKIEREMEGGR